jgi:hypothetical protein
MNNDVFLSILAMDSYNRGYGAGVSFGENSDAAGTQLGIATIQSHSSNDLTSPEVASGFYALSYSWNGQTVISYRGTDSYKIFSGASDLWNGWTVGAGFSESPQATLAMDFYQSVTFHSVFDHGSTPLLTGHSLGGGLAGFIGALSTGKSYGFDHMPFGVAAYDAVISEALRRAEASVSFTLTDILASLVLGTAGPLGNAYTTFVNKLELRELR